MGSARLKDEAKHDRVEQREAAPAAASRILDLQRDHGNAAVVRMLAAHPSRASIARFTRNVTNYDYDGAGTLFSSQSIRGSSTTRAPEAERSRTDVGESGGLEQTSQHFAAGAGHGQGSWNDDAGGAKAVAGKPPIRVSENRKFALQDAAQPRVFFVEAASVAAANTALKGGGIRILLTGGPSIKLATGEVLQQAAIEKEDQGKFSGKVANAVAEGCNDVANEVMGSTSAGGVDKTIDPAQQPNAAAAPAIGQSFAFQSGYDENAGAATVMPSDGKKRDSMIGAAIAEWQQVEARMQAKIDVTHTKISEQARAMLFGWASHFEGVIFEDGGDRLTLVNYNRGTELRHEKRRMFADLYLRMPDFRRRFLELVEAEQRKQQDFDRESKRRGHVQNPFDWQRVMMLMDPLRKELRDTITQAVPKKVLDDLETHERMVKEQGATMWYFDLYGSGKNAENDTFNARWGGSSSRGAGGSTRVLS